MSDAADLVSGHATALTDAVQRRQGRQIMSLCALWLGMVGAAQAQSCWSSGASEMAFGAVGLGQSKDAASSLNYTCQSAQQTAYFRLCMRVSEGSPIPGVSPRWMTNYNANNQQAQLAYMLYSDPARTQELGSPPLGSGSFTEYSWTLEVPAGWQQRSLQQPIYGRVPAGQQSLPATPYQAQMHGSQLYWIWSESDYPASCYGGDGGSGNVAFYMSASASLNNACYISTASDMDFGATDSLVAPRSSNAAVSLFCPAGSSWQIGLDNGQNAADGQTRRMRNAAGAYIRYELYRDASRSQRWGQTLNSDTVQGTGTGTLQHVTVHGQVPSQTAPSSGSYSDVITITLTY